MDDVPIWTTCQCFQFPDTRCTGSRTDVEKKGAIQLLVDNVCLQHLVVEGLGCVICSRHLESFWTGCCVRGR